MPAHDVVRRGRPQDVAGGQAEFERIVHGEGHPQASLLLDHSHPHLVGARGVGSRATKEEFQRRWPGSLSLRASHHHARSVHASVHQDKGRRLFHPGCGGWRGATSPPNSDPSKTMFRIGRVVRVFTRCAHIQCDTCNAVLVRLWYTGVLLWGNGGFWYNLWGMRARWTLSCNVTCGMRDVCVLGSHSHVFRVHRSSRATHFSLSQKLSRARCCCTRSSAGRPVPLVHVGGIANAIACREIALRTATRRGDAHSTRGDPRRGMRGHTLRTRGPRGVFVRGCRDDPSRARLRKRDRRCASRDRAVHDDTHAPRAGDPCRGMRGHTLRTRGCRRPVRARLSRRDGCGTKIFHINGSSATLRSLTSAIVPVQHTRPVECSRGSNGEYLTRGYRCW